MFVFVYSRNERDKKLSQIEKDYDNNRIAYRNERSENLENFQKKKFFSEHLPPMGQSTMFGQ